MRCFAALLFAAALPAFAQKPEPAAIDALFADLTKPGSPGCALGVYRDGKIIFSKGYGLANLENGAPITPNTIFDLGSTSKQFTAASILLLEKQGKLRLDDDVRKFVPELPEYSGSNGGKITILNLLNHTSGIRDYLALFHMAGIDIDSVTTDETALAILSRQKALNFAPGSEFLYSNSGYFLLSVIVKRASGKNLREFAHEHIFSPLAMPHTLYRDSHHLLIPNRAQAYDPAANGAFQLDISYFEQLGDGAVHTSVEDLLHWDENFYSAKVGGKHLVAEMQERGLLSTGRSIDYAKGLFLGEFRGLPIVNHGGSWGGYRAQLLRFPLQHFSVACLCNVGNANPERRASSVAELYLAAAMKPKPGTSPVPLPGTPRPTVVPPVQQPDAGKLRPYAGDYVSTELGVIYRLAIVDQKLTVTAILDAGGFPRASDPTALRSTGEDQFALGRGVVLRFSRDPQGQPATFQADAGRTKGIVFTRSR